VTNVDFKDKKFFDNMKDPSKKAKIEETLFHLSLCHTIITEVKNDEI